MKQCFTSSSYIEYLRENSEINLLRGFFENQG